ncbi:MAG TPA: ABC transporter permease [Tepidisphaeraceae bacterium]|nr:ABC transporter permease [Tepidisphaeraceae bacterium]
MSEINAIFAISYRDLLKLLRDPVRMASTFVFPLIFIAILGGSLQANFGSSAGYNMLTFVFTGVLAQTLFQSTAQGVISLLEDRENDFSQEIFVSPISRYSIVFGKVLGEALVAIPQGAAILFFGLVLGVTFSLSQLLGLLIVGLAICLLGGSFGMLMLSLFNTRRAANEIFPFLLFPQFFTAGVFTPVKVLPPYLEVLSRISPMRYGVDLLRNTFYIGLPDAGKVVLDPLVLNLGVGSGLFLLFMAVGTALFVRNERNR